MAYRTREENTKYMRDYRQRRRAKQDAQIATKADEKKSIVTIRLPESIVARVQRMVHDGRRLVPYRTPGEMFRALVLRGLELIKDHAPDEWESLRPILALRGQLDDVTTARTEAQSIVARVQQEVAELLAMGNKPTAAHLYNTAMHAAHDMEPTAYRDWLIATLRKKYRHLEHVKAPAAFVRDRARESWDAHEERRQQQKRIPAEKDRRSGGGAAARVKATAAARKKR